MKIRHYNAWIWLQEDEEEGLASCGCRLINDEDGARIIMCPTHSAAPDLLAALETALPELENELERREISGMPEYIDPFAKVVDVVRAAIAKALGELE